MKNKVFYYFIVFIISLNSCSIDEYSERQKFSELNGKYKVKKIGFNEISRNKILWEKLNEIISSQQANSLTNRFENSFFSVNLEYATYIERNDDNYHSYTFCVLSDQDSIYNINNLVLSTTDNRIYEADIVTYELTENDYVQLLTESGSSINFDNKIFIFMVLIPLWFLYKKLSEK